MLTGELDPSRAMSFVTGLTFSVGTDEDVSFTMIPILFDANAIFEDGFEVTSGHATERKEVAGSE